MKNIRIFISENFPFLVEKFSIYLNRQVFVMHIFQLQVYYWTENKNAEIYYCLLFPLFLSPYLTPMQCKGKFTSLKLVHITKTCLYNFDPLKPHFYIVKLGFAGVLVIFLISAQNIDCGYSLEPPRRGGSNEYAQSMFCAEIGKISEFFIWKFSVFGDEIFYIFE